MIRLFIRFCFALILTVHGVSSFASDRELHSQWNDLLQAHVVSSVDGSATAVDYAGFAADAAALDAYLNALSAVSMDQYRRWDQARQLAFLINAYNAFTVKLILSEYPDLDSIRDLGTWFSSPWKKQFVPLLDSTLSLDDIEHGLIRAPDVFSEPRIHFAVNCASIGCPALREEAYTGALLNQQLEQQTLRFLQDRSRNYSDGKTLYLSSIFKWYGDDFVPQFFLQYAEALGLNAEQKNALKKRKLRIRYLDYNWSLNAVD